MERQPRAVRLGHGAEGAIGRFTVRLTFQLLGLELDVTFGPAEAAGEDDPLRDLGATGGTFVGFVANHDMPDEAAIHRPCSPFEDDSEIRRR